MVTGASSGLGAAISEALVEKGALVFGLARNKSALDKLKKTLGENFIPVELDISENKAVASLITETFSEEINPHISLITQGLGLLPK